MTEKLMKSDAIPPQNMPEDALNSGFFRHRFVFLVIAIVGLGASKIVEKLLVAPAEAATQASWLQWFLVAAVVVLGVPHGALDFVKARKQLPVLKLILYVTIYVGITIFSLVALTLCPRLILPILLLIASWHFGETYKTIFEFPQFPVITKSMGFGVTARKAGVVIALITIGALPISVAIYSHADAVNALFTAISSPLAAVLVINFMQVGIIIFIGLPLLCGAYALWRMMRGGKVARKILGLDALEILATFFIFAFAPPLLAFTLYFCFIHAPRHTAIALKALEFKSQSATISESLPDIVTPTKMPTKKLQPVLLVLEALVISASAVVLLMACYWFLQGKEFDLIPTWVSPAEAVAVLFGGLLSITVAHASHDALCKRLYS